MRLKMKNLTFSKVSMSLIALALLAVFGLAGCGDGGGGGGSDPDTTYSISGKVADSSNVGISGVTVGLTGASTSSTTTDSSGNFTFTGLANESYTVTPSKTDYTFNPANKAVTVSGADITGQDFVGSATGHSISGNVGDSLNADISGVTVALTGASTSSTTTDSSGNYTFTGLANGSYTVTPSKTGYTFNPASKAVTVSGADITGQNFVGALVNLTDTTTTDITVTVPSINTSGGKDNLQMYASVVIQDGTPLTNLTAGNFTLEETINGITKTVPITSITTSGSSGSSISTALVLDSSGSLSSSEVEDIKTAAKSFVNNMKSTDYAAVIDFDTDVTTRQFFTNNKSLLNSAIDSISSGGATSLYDAIYDAVTLTASQNGQKAVIVMTDGQNNSSSHTETDAISYAVSMGIPVYTIGMGDGVNVTVLKGISDGTHAGSNGSGYYTAPTSTELTALYNKISNVLNNVYIIGWSSTGSSGDTAFVKITVNYAAANGTFTESFTTSYIVPGTASGGTYSISGRVADSFSVGISGVTVTLSGGGVAYSEMTDSSGNYTFVNLVNDSYTLTPSKTGYTFNPASKAVTVSGADITGQNFVGSATGGGGTTGSDSYEPNDTFATASAALVSGNAVTAKIGSSTDVDYYVINVASSGTVSISMTPPSNMDYDLVLYNSSQVSVASSANGTGSTETISYFAASGTYYIKVYGYQGAFDANNTYSLTATCPTSGSGSYSISGRVANSSNVAISGVTVALTGATTSSATTDSSGNYYFTGLVNGNYTLTPSKTGYTFNPASRTVTVSGANITGQDFVGSVVPITLASGLNWARDIAVDSTSVYWTEFDTSGTVKKVPINGGTITTLAAGLNWPTGIAVDSTSVYWAEQAGNVKKVSINGGMVTTLASGMSTIWGMTADSSNVYWTETGTVKKVSKNGGAVTTLVSGIGSADNIAVDSTSVYWTGNGGGMGLGTVKKVGINGGTVTTLVASGLNQPQGIAVDSTNAYWTEFGGSVKKVSINGGTVTTLASGLSSTSGIAVDSTSVYWKDDNPMAVKKVGINGGTVTTLATSSTSGQPAGIVVDSTNVYWTMPDAVKKISK